MPLMLPDARHRRCAELARSCHECVLFRYSDRRDPAMHDHPRPHPGPRSDEPGFSSGRRPIRTAEGARSDPTWPRRSDASLHARSTGRAGSSVGGPQPDGSREQLRHSASATARSALARRCVSVLGAAGGVRRRSSRPLDRIRSGRCAALRRSGRDAEPRHGGVVARLLKYPPRQIHVSSPRRVMDHANIVVHGRRTIDRIWHRGLPVTTPSQAILDYAATDRASTYSGSCSPTPTSRGSLRSATLQAQHRPRHRRERRRSGTRWRSTSPSSRLTRSRAERLLLIICQRWRHQDAGRRQRICPGYLVDAVWRDAQADRRDRRDARPSDACAGPP